MKNVKLMIIVWLGAAFLSGSFALAAPVLPLTGQVTIADLTPDEPAILPNNPFYNLKSWFEWLSGGSSLPALMERLNNKAAEVLKSQQVASNNLDLLIKTLRNYDSVVLAVFTKIKKISASDVGSAGSAKAEDFFSLVDERLIIHLRFISDLQSTVQPASVTVLIDEITNDLRDALIFSQARLEASDGFSNRVWRLAQNAPSDLYPLRVSEVLRGVLDRASITHSLTSEQTQDMRALLNNLLIMVAGSFEGQVISGNQTLIAALPNVAGDRLIRLITLAALGEDVSGPDIKSSLSLMRTTIVETLNQTNALLPGAVSFRVHLANQQVDWLAQEIAAANDLVYPTIQELYARSKFNSEQAIALLDMENYGGAYLQASLAQGASEAALVQLPQTEAAYQQELLLLRAWYDSLASRAKAFSASANNEELAGTIIRLLNDAATHIAETSARIVSRREWTAIPVNIQNLKLRLATIDALASE